MSSVIAKEATLGGEPEPDSQAATDTTSPERRKFVIEDGQFLEVLTASLGLFLRAGSGAVVSGWSPSLERDRGQRDYTLVKFKGTRLDEGSDIYKFRRPLKSLEVYEFEGCPYCKMVREALSILDLDVMVYPCPQGGRRWRQKAAELSCQDTVPVLRDPNTATVLHDSTSIIQHLFQNYGGGEVPLPLRLTPLAVATAGLTQMARFSRGTHARPSAAAPEPLELWGHEGSPFVKLVRERLCELEIPYFYKTCARGSLKRREMVESLGDFQVPYIKDPNTGRGMFESHHIVEYLQRTYGDG
uniref:Thioredoxin family protein n=1 Tax=Tetraselmis sp. GSL018 TaxID=582737 RepID=A0A061QSF8_9CHLO|eukprot:CAMPEP_0177619524 /NCGR_PEP_ID=MMETSP0419_2-20121207/26325_1 /TAXON_ID=582737 /ORGANISM="Tetraselmis sp., Strain GSL018" /LENGTH=299 /DNA_ID=CAMNT_0019118835 /DNA_START=575 /DNA_END=1474 /DNA_ORIENTATION=+